MRHRVKKVKLNRDFDHRHQLGKNLVRSLFLEGVITTTEAKAKWLSSLASRLITTAKEGTLSSTRRLIAKTSSSEVVAKIVESAKGLSARQGGYIKLSKLGIRPGDKAVKVKVEIVK